MLYIANESAFRRYARSNQLKKAIEWLSGKKLPAYSYGNPDLYILAKKDENTMSVALCNAFADSIFKPCIELDREYKKITPINCTAEISGNKVYLSELAPFSIAAFEVSE